MVFWAELSPLSFLETFCVRCVQLGHKTGVGDKYTHIFVAYSSGTQWHCLACGGLKRSCDSAGVNVWDCAGGSAEGGATELSLTGLQSTNVIFAWKNHDLLLLKEYDKPASWKIALWVLCKGMKWGTRLLPRVKLCLIKKWKSPAPPQRPRRGRIMLWHK